AALKNRVGAAAYGEALARHDAIFKEIVAAPGAGILKDTGDGFFVRFSSVSDAVIAALRFDDALRKMPAELCALSARVGIHVGEVIELPAENGGGEKVVGLAVDIAARLAALARGGQILLSRLAFNEARQFVRA